MEWTPTSWARTAHGNLVQAAVGEEGPMGSGLARSLALQLVGGQSTLDHSLLIMGRINCGLIIE
jgi:hypothetical protein